jgi:hypothetical protein
MLFTSFHSPPYCLMGNSDQRSDSAYTVSALNKLQTTVLTSSSFMHIREILPVAQCGRETGTKRGKRKRRGVTCCVQRQLRHKSVLSYLDPRAPRAEGGASSRTNDGAPRCAHSPRDVLHICSCKRGRTAWLMEARGTRLRVCAQIATARGAGNAVA